MRTHSPRRRPGGLRLGRLVVGLAAQAVVGVAVVTAVISQGPAASEQSMVPTGAHTRPVVSRDDQRTEVPGASASVDPSSSPTIEAGPQPRQPVRDAGKALQTHRDHSVGLASYNIFVDQSLAGATADAHRLTSDPRVDIIAWQEAAQFTSGLKAQQGWTTYAPGGPASRDNPVSWRTDEFDLVGEQVVLAQDQMKWVEGEHKLFKKYVLVVALRDRVSGQLITVVNTHLDHSIEAYKSGSDGHPNYGEHLDVADNQLRIVRSRLASGRGLVVAAGDFNADAFADLQVRSQRLPWGRLHPVAESNWMLLGRDGLPPTHKATGRYIDQIWTARHALRGGAMVPRSEQVLYGYHSDHRPLLVTFDVAALP